MQGAEGKMRKEQSLILEGFNWEESFHISKLNQTGRGESEIELWEYTRPYSSSLFS